MESRRKVTLALLFVMTLLLAGASIFITIRIQQNNAANDANASGFGQNATTNKFGSVFEEFAKYPCTDLLNNNRLSKDSGLLITKIDSTINNLELLGALPYLPMNCTYNLPNDKAIQVMLHSYDTDSFIDNSAADLYVRINSNLESQLDSQTYGTDPDTAVKVFYGKDANLTENVCRANLFQGQNDFEYAEIIYTGYTDCSTLINDNKAISKSISSVIVEAMSRVNKKF